MRAIQSSIAAKQIVMGVGYNYKSISRLNAQCESCHGHLRANSVSLYKLQESFFRASSAVTISVYRASLRRPVPIFAAQRQNDVVEIKEMK